MSFRDQGRIRDHNRTIMALGADEDKAEIKRTTLAHWAYRYIGNVVLSRPVAQCS